ncbi:Tannase/feruloyl esterase [Aspergillus pseudonomiae]|uniref:Carboxylic ester hydrolase n=1 Tax=Aspergillus pseudonomiae TaxID=1506151 RepID=A0A5N6IAL8_9EURO|nr:Tannase/feruloyl esterase [Aspergillus pseudonomiae]KAB8263107.1 Tannase/feruloyl esterase [Aspergillus pseudonomiae]KAE8408644.1 Tannase/feruloyl esterase [Aspergillus pseudonomiae]
MRALFITYVLATLEVVKGIPLERKHKVDCANLAGTFVNNAALIHHAQSVPIGGLTLSDDGNSVQNQVPLCHVQGTIDYIAGGDATPDPRRNNTLTWELYLPDEPYYNGRFLAVGNGGFAGDIDNTTMLTNLNSGFAVAGCDSGHPVSESEHSGPDDSVPFLDDIAKVKSWIHNSIAMTTNVTRTITAKYYAERPTYSYFWGCSTGGAQGYALAQYHPTLFDGIYAGSPGNWYSHLILSFLWNGLHATGKGFMSQDVLNFITNRTVAACDELDGVKDGLIENPLRCHFDIKTLECQPSQTPIVNDETLCLTTAQIQTALQVYSGPKDQRTGKQIYPGFDLGSETGWLAQETSLYSSYAAPILRQLVFKDRTYNVTSFNWGSDVDYLDHTTSPAIDEISPDLSAFSQRGGKLITVQGWADQYNAATWPIEHLKRIQSTVQGQHASDFIRLFMVPGGGHCGANPAYSHVPATYHVLDALLPWVEDGIGPEEIVSSTPPNGSNTTRKLCVWPKEARILNGSVSDWKSYKCA